MPLSFLKSYKLMEFTIAYLSLLPCPNLLNQLRNILSSPSRCARAEFDWLGEAA